MPELPEVETTVRGLRKNILGQTIKDVWTDLKTKDKRKKDSVANPKFFSFFKKQILNKKIISVQRRAKNILINLNNQQTILIHLKMTGHLLFNNRDNYVHLLFTFSKGSYLAFSDIRKFGKITLIPTNKIHQSKHLKDLGPEPLEKSFTLEKFKINLNKKTKTKIKTALLDQKVLAGIGNIYSDEILWQAEVNPERKVNSLKEIEVKKIYKAIKPILDKSIKLGGDSMSDYINVDGEKGKFQLYHKAYRKTGEKCSKKNCKGVIKRKMINGRSAHFCSKHQK